jgi:hypothetical protein
MQQGQPEGLKVQKEIENMQKKYKSVSKMQQYQWSISVL